MQLNANNPMQCYIYVNFVISIFNEKILAPIDWTVLHKHLRCRIFAQLENIIHKKTWMSALLTFLRMINLHIHILAPSGSLCVTTMHDYWSSNHNFEFSSPQTSM